MKELLVLLEDQLHILTGICAGIHRPAGATIADKMLFMDSQTCRISPAPGASS
jgi:hypothetical protein